MTTPAYHRYLHTWPWRLRRWLRLLWAGHRCENCGNRAKPLQCHHRTYERLFHERISDLQILCIDCHPLADEQRRRNKAIETFGLKKYGPPWVTIKERVELEFDEWLASKAE